MLPDPAAIVPAPAIIAVVAPIALAAALLLAALVGHLRVRRAVPTPYTRKLYHIGIFSLAAGVHFVWGAPAVLVYGTVVSGVVIAAVMRGDGYPFYEAIARETDRPHRSALVLVPLEMTAVGGLVSTLLFERFASVGYLVAGWGDALGEPVGTRWGRRRYRVPSLRGVPATRSLEGSLAVFAGGVVAASIALAAGGLPVTSVVPAALGAGLAGAAVEAVSHHGFDNLTVQVAATAASAWIAGLTA